MAMKRCSVIPKSPSITGSSPSDCLVSYPGHSLEGSYPSAEVQLVYSTANWAIEYQAHCLQIIVIFKAFRPICWFKVACWLLSLTWYIWRGLKDASDEMWILLLGIAHLIPTIRTLAPHHENYTSQTNQTRGTLLEKQGRAHKRCTPVDPHIWMCKSRTTSTNLHTATMWGHRM